jgi:hypothetical protein
MSITQAPMGLNTVTITVDPGETIAAQRAVINSWITTHGWELVPGQSLVTSDVYRCL